MVRGTEERTSDSEPKDNPEFWMTELPPKLRNIPFIYLAIPGSHDSTTFTISYKSKVAPDAAPIVKKLRFLGPLLTCIMSRWSRTQNYDIVAQLKQGIRYFDLRIATRERSNEMFFVHGLYGEEVNPIFKDVRTFLDEHPSEVVILDCQHFYNFQPSDHDRFIDLLSQTFKGKLLPSTPHLAHISLDHMTRKLEYQVLVIYRSDEMAFDHRQLWPSRYFPTPWPNTVSVSDLFSVLTDNLRWRHPQLGYVSQCVLTPTVWFVFRHIWSSLKTQCFKPLEKSTINWLCKQIPGPTGVNIIIADFVDQQGGLFAKKVIGLNDKLLDSACMLPPYLGVPVEP